jgi:hypothetical protein
MARIPAKLPSDRERRKVIIGRIREELEETAKEVKLAQTRLGVVEKKATGGAGNIDEHIKLAAFGKTDTHLKV